MRAIRVHQHGGPEVLTLEELRDPEPGPGQAVIRLDASGVNFFDIRQRTGDYKVALPITLGNEGAGVVTAVGPGADGIAVGQRVGWQMVQGSYAEQAVVPVDQLVVLPDGISTQQAAAVLLQGLTAHAMATSAYSLKEGDTALVHAAAGGVGALLTQLAIRRGARVIGVVSSRAKADRAARAGASDVVISTEEDFAAAARRLTGGRGADVVYDSIGRDTFAGSIAALRPGGYMIMFGQASGGVSSMDPHLLAKDGGRYLTYAATGQFITNPSQLRERANELFGLMLDGSLNVPVTDVFPLADAAAAQAVMTSRRTMGKLLLDTTVS